MTVTLRPADGVRRHPVVATPQPTAQVIIAGPGHITWRVYDAAADFNTRTYEAYAAGNVRFSVAAGRSGVSRARLRAKIEVDRALLEVVAIFRERSVRLEGDPAQPVGISEIAERLDVQRQTVDNWRRRPIGFPAPRWTVGGRPAWDWADIRRWASHTDRLHSDTRE